MMFKELSGNALKVIAIVAMTIDHLAWVGIETYEQAETPTQIFLHLRLELCRPAGHTHDRPEPGLLPQADALDDGHHLALRRRLLHIPQSHLRHGPPGLLAGSTAAGDVQRPARTAEYNQITYTPS